MKLKTMFFTTFEKRVQERYVMSLMARFKQATLLKDNYKLLVYLRSDCRHFLKKHPSWYTEVNEIIELCSKWLRY